ncbi:MAG TPA: DUF1947 domain-containing protein [Pyrodictium sp.]|nr:DUF1947 domain-containing protein [Pyrodictium sp.]
MRRWMLSKRDRKKLEEELARFYPQYTLPKEAKVEYAIIEDIELVIIDRLPAFIKIDDKYIPHLLYLLKKGYSWLPQIVVDSGAVKPISRGADLMRPGIMEIVGEFDTGTIVVILEPSRRLPIAVHRTLYGSRTIIGMERGRGSKRLHYVGDRYWKLADKLL